MGVPNLTVPVRGVPGAILHLPVDDVLAPRFHSGPANYLFVEIRKCFLSERPTSVITNCQE
jgi:hypothetical protein